MRKTLKFIIKSVIFDKFSAIKSGYISKTSNICLNCGLIISNFQHFQLKPRVHFCPLFDGKKCVSVLSA